MCLVLMSRRERMLCVEMPALARLGTAYRSGAEVLRWRTMQRRGGGHSVLRRARKYFLRGSALILFSCISPLF